MATASAVPNNLYDYAKKTTQSNDAAKTQATKLADAIFQYSQGVIDFGKNIDGITAVGSLDISYLILQNLAAVRATDQKVHDVGAAFQLADTPGLRVDHSDTDTVITDEAQLDEYLAELPSTSAGAALAKYANSGEVDNHVFQELAAHQNDYAFITAFLANLNITTMRGLSDDLAMSYHAPLVAHVFVVAFSRGMTYSTRRLAGVMYTNNVWWNSRLWALFENELAKNPQAAKGFLDSSINRIVQPMEMDGTNPPNTPPPWSGELSELAKINETKFLEIATAAMSVSHGIEADALYDQVTAAVQQSSDNYQALLGPLKTFVGTYLAATIPSPPTHATHRQLSDWAQSVADLEAKKLATWHDWILKSAQHQQDDRSAAINWENFGIGVAISVVTSVFTLNPALGIAAGVASSVATTWPVEWVTNQLAPATGNPYKDATRFHQAISASLKAVAVVDFLKNGEIVDKYGKAVPPTKEDARTVLEHQQDYLVAGTKDVGLDYILDGIDTVVLKDM